MDTGTGSHRDSLRVVTLNLWGRRGAWPERRDVLASGLAKLAPDLVTFQEEIADGAYDQTQDLLGPDIEIVRQRAREPDGQGISIASRWPIRDVCELDLHVTQRTRDFACGTLVAEIAAPDPFGPLLFVNHLPSWQLSFEYERELQAVIAARYIEERRRETDWHVILTGDFDADPRAASVRFWAGLQSLDGMSVCYRDAWESAHAGESGHTFTPDNHLVADPDWPFRRIDYIFVRCGLHGGPTLAISRCERIFGEAVDDVWASDHFGLVADLRLPHR